MVKFRPCCVACFSHIQSMLLRTRLAKPEFSSLPFAKTSSTMPEIFLRTFHDRCRRSARTRLRGSFFFVWMPGRSFSWLGAVTWCSFSWLGAITWRSLCNGAAVNRSYRSYRSYTAWRPITFFPWRLPDVAWIGWGAITSRTRRTKSFAANLPLRSLAARSSCQLSRSRRFGRFGGGDYRAVALRWWERIFTEKCRYTLINDRGCCTDRKDLLRNAGAGGAMLYPLAGWPSADVFADLHTPLVLVSGDSTRQLKQPGTVVGAESRRRASARALRPPF